MDEELKYTNWYAELPEKGSDGKFGPKLTFRDRMAWYCIYHHENNRSLSKRAIAEAAGISVPVANMLLSPNNGKYKNVKDEYNRLGPAKSYQEYVEEKHIRRAQAVRYGSKPPAKPGQINLGGFEFTINQLENGQWAANCLDPEMPNGWHATREEAVNECLKILPFLRGE